MPIRHIYTNGVADGTATSVVRPSDWNSIHAYTLQDAISLAGNTAGVLANISDGTFVLAGGNNITVSQNGNSVTVSGPNVAGAQTGISGIVASDTTYTSGSVHFSGNNITIASSVNGASQYVKLSGHAAQTNQSAIKGFGVSDTGQTAGNTGLSTGIDWVMAGSNLITLSQSTVGGGPNTIWIQHPAWLTTAALSGDSSKYAGVNGAITGGSITVNTSGVSINLPAYLTTADLSANSSKYAGTGFTSAGANISLSGTLNTAGLSLSASVAAQSNQSAIKAFGVSNTGQTAGNTGVSTGIDWVLAGSGSITLSQSTTAGGPNSIWFQHPAWLTTAAQSNQVVQSINGSTGTFSFNTGSSLSSSRNGNAFTFGLASDITSALQSAGAYLTTADLSANSSKYVQNWKLTGNTSGTTSSAQGTDLWFSGGNSITVSGNSNTIVFSVGNYLTTAMASNRGSDFVAATAAFAGTNASGTIASNGISVSVAAPGAALESNWVNLLGANTTGNTTASGSTIGWSGGNGVTLSGTNNSQVVISVSTYSTVGTATTAAAVASANSVGTVTRWAAEDHAHAGVAAIGISTAGNTAGTTGSEVGTYWLQGGQSITLSQITSNNGSHTLIVSGPQGGYCGWLEPFGMTNTAQFGPGAGSWYLAPFIAAGSISGGRINFLMVNTGTAQLFRDFTEGSVVSSSTGAQQQGYTYSLAAAIFSAGTGSNSTRLESKWSNSFSFGWTKSVSVSSSNVSQFQVTVAHTLSYIKDIGSDGAYTMTSYTNSSNSQVANSSTASNFADSIMSSGRNIVSGSVVYPIGFNTTFSAGAYWLGFAWSSTRSNASTGTRIGSALDFSQSSIVGISRLELETLYRNFGSTVTTARSHLMPYGLYTAAANMAPPSAIALSSDLSSLASAWVPYFNFQVAGLTK